MALIKFNFFFLLGFLIQTISLIGDPKHDLELPFTVAGIFFALVVMGLAIYCAMFEKKAGTAAVVVRSEPTDASLVDNMTKHIGRLPMWVLRSI